MLKGEVVPAEGLVKPYKVTVILPVEYLLLVVITYVYPTSTTD